MNPLIFPAPAHQLSISLIRRNHVHRFSHGVYASPASPPDLLFRVRAAHLRFPSGVIGGFAALAYHGVPYWWDIPLATVHTPARGVRENPHLHLIKGVRFQEVTGLDQIFPDLICVDAATATIDCMIYVLRERITYWTAKVTGLWLTELRAVQILDAARRYAGVTLQAVRKAARRRLCQRRLKRLMKLSVPNADSPQETTLRLMLKRLLPGWTTQHEVYENGTLITIVDFAWVHLKVAIYYDGEHHGDQKNIDRDNEILAYLEEQGWQVMRVTKGMLRREQDLMRRVRRKLEKAGAEFGNGN